MQLGRYVPDGMLFSNAVANLSAQPDGAFVSYKSLQEGKVVLVEGAKQGIVELDGEPDMVVEVVSDSSVEKDKKTLPDLYYNAGVLEYWLIDARNETLDFTIFQRGADRFEPMVEHEGWVASKVFGREFRLSQRSDPLGHPEFLLDFR
jgi:Uma2 family endonuclease